MKKPDPLDELLSDWQVTAEMPRSFQRDVWARVATDQSSPKWWESLAQFILKPRLLALSAVSAISIGALAAVMHSAQPPIDPHTAYVRSISPFASVHLTSSH